MSGIPNLPESFNRAAPTAARMNGAPGSVPSEIEDVPIDSTRPIKVIVIGAGFSGIDCGIRIPQRLRNVELVIYEKNPDVGGTWYENRYPGCACDVPAHSYQYSYAPNHAWSSFYAPGPEIREYLEGVATKFSVYRFIKLRHSVRSCEWDENVGKWRVRVENLIDGTIFEDSAHVVISARGTLNDYKWPEVPGLHSFEGLLVHSAAWNPEAELDGKTIGVIGAGSSAIQIVPQLQSRPSTRLKCFVRSKTWISPPFGAETVDKLGMEGLDFSEEQKIRFAEHPQEYHDFRKMIEQDGNSAHFLTHKDSEIQRTLRDVCKNIMSERLADRPDVAEKITPSFAVGCRRLTPGLGFLETLTKPNVEFIGTNIDHVTPSGVILVDGTEVKLDVLVCATGFNAAHAPPFTIKGANGLDMASQFDPYPKTYLSLAMGGFPNFFMILGPNSLIGTGSLTMMLESQVDYAVKCIRKLQRENIRSMSPKLERIEEFSRYIDHYFKQTVYLDGCNSWYLSNHGIGPRVIGLWPGSCLHAIEAFRAPRWEDYDYTYETDEQGEEFSRMKWLGNGYTHAQRFRDGDGDLAFYLEPEYLDVPSTPLPEETRSTKIRPFCY